LVLDLVEHEFARAGLTVEDPAAAAAEFQPSPDVPAGTFRMACGNAKLFDPQISSATVGPD